METLNPDCLLQIFLNLDFIERVRLETVCHVWNYVLRQRYTFADISKLNIADFVANNASNYYQQESLSFTPTVVGIVERCGPYVEEMTFGNRWLRISQPIIDCIAINCHRLRKLDLGGAIINADISPLLDMISSQLEEFSLEETSWVVNNHGKKVQQYFKYMTSIKRVNLRSVMWDLTLLDDFNTTLEFLDIGGAKSLPITVFKAFLEKHVQLRELNLCRVSVLDDECIELLAEHTNMERLHIGYSDDGSLNFLPLAALTKMRSLHLQNVAALTELTLDVMLDAMNDLDELSILSCKNIHDYTSLGHCRKLSVLAISDTMQLDNEDIYTLCTFGNLKHLTLSNCFNLSTRGVNIALMRCQLKQLTVNKCSRVTDDMMYTLASTQRELESISIQGCTAVTSKGVSALAWLRNVQLLREVDVSRNKHVDDTVVLSLHNALTMASRRAEQEARHRKSPVWKKLRLSSCVNDDDNLEQLPQQQKLIMYIFDTSITESVRKRVEDLITLY